MGKKRRAAKAASGRKKQRASNVSAAGHPEPETTIPPKLLKQVIDDPHDLSAALDLADFCARHGRESKITEFLHPHVNKYPFNDKDQNKSFNFLLALGYANTRQFCEAEEVLERARRDGQSSADLWFVYVQVKHSMREYERVIESGQGYLAAVDENVDEPPSGVTVTSRHSAQVLDFMGLAYGELHQTNEAMDAIERALVLDPGFHQPYLNLARLLARLDRPEEARNIIERGLKKCRQVQELRLVLKCLDEQPSISACMIVKDEEELLPECLESIRDWVTEIVVVDTGSTDRTVEIAREYGARVFHQEWENDFSKHRNYSIEQATSDWVFIIDADERFVLDDVPLIKDAMRLDRFAMISLSVFNVYPEQEIGVTFANSVRFFKRELNLRYEGIVHNELERPEGVPILGTAARLDHLGYGLSPERMAVKYDRTRQLLQQQLNEDPDNVFALFNYSQLLRGAPDAFSEENASKIISLAGRVVELIGPDDHRNKHLRLMCLDHLAATYLARKDFSQALEYCTAALQLRPDYLDGLIHLGFAYHGLKDYHSAVQQFETYLKAQSEFDGAKEFMPIILTYPDSRDLAYSHLGVLHELQNDPETAKKSYIRALQENPDHAEAATWLGRVYLSEGDVKNAEKYFRHQFNHSGPTPDALLGLARLHLDRDEETEAHRLYEEAAEVFSDSSPVFIEFGRFLMTRGRDQEAAEAFDRAVELAEDTSRLAVQVAEICFECDRYETAAGFYQRAIDAGEPVSELLNDLGNCYFKLGQYSHAEAQYLKACELVPPTLLAHRNLGVTRVRLDRPQAAISPLERYLEVNPEEPTVRQLLADQYRLVGDLESAIGQYEKLLVSQPENAAALLGLSESYFLMGHRDAALLGFRRLLEIDPHCRPALDRVSQLTESVRQT